jgi:hypothetical protein
MDKETPRHIKSVEGHIFKSEYNFKIPSLQPPNPYHPLAIIFALMMEAASTSETSVNFYQTIRRYMLEDIFILAAART